MFTPFLLDFRFIRSNLDQKNNANNNRELAISQFRVILQFWKV